MEEDNSLWIAKVVAETLHNPAYREMREGFICEVHNSSGCHTPSLEASMELHEEWLEKAEAVEAEGLYRFTADLKGLAEDYKREAERLEI